MEPGGGCTATGDPSTGAAGAGTADTVSAGAAAGIQTNTAQVSSPSSEISPTDDAEIVVITRADLQMIKSHAPDADADAGSPMRMPRLRG